MSFIQEILSCLCRDISSNDYDSTSEKSQYDTEAQEIVDVLYDSEKSGLALQTRLDEIISSGGWNERLAEAILYTLENSIQAGRVMSGVLEEAYKRAVDAVNKTQEFERDHPLFSAILVTIVVLGILVLLMPWAIEALGFAAEGPVAGKYRSKKR